MREKRPFRTGTLLEEREDVKGTDTVNGRGGVKERDADSEVELPHNEVYVDSALK